MQTTTTSFTNFAQRARLSAFARAGLWITLLLALATPTHAAESQVLQGHVPAAVSRLQPVERLTGGQRLNLAIALPLRNQAELGALLKDLYDPGSPSYRHWLTPAQFTERFGPTVADYQAVAEWAKANGLAITAANPDRVLLDVQGTVAGVEAALHVTLQVYQHPAEARTFYAPDREPSLDLAVKIAHVSGLDNYALPRPRVKVRPLDQQSKPGPNAGGGPGGTYMAADFRAAYAPDTTLTGVGQSVGLLQFDGYAASDIAYYVATNHLPSITLSNILLDGFSGTPTGSGGEVEVCLDIESSMAMAPGLSTIYVYEAGPSGLWHDILSRMANDNLAKQLSCSWYIPGGAMDTVADGYFQQMASQGQSFFNASGDSDAYCGPIDFPGDTPYITQVGGTTLFTAGPAGAYTSEQVWNWGGGTGGGGGISTQYPIPSWQTGISMTANHGSVTMRNTPDVALTADQVYVRADGTDHSVGGTSAAAPLWAGFTALINQQAVARSSQTVGFLNPGFTTVGLGANYGSAFHDIVVGNNTNTTCGLTRFPAIPSYDLATGWGTPRGQGTIDAFAGLLDPLALNPYSDLVSQGYQFGPFTPSNIVYTLSNSDTNAISWGAGVDQPWVTVGLTGGTIAVGGSTNVTVSLNAVAATLTNGTFHATVSLTNDGTGFVYTRGVTLVVIPIPGNILVLDSIAPSNDLQMPFGNVMVGLSRTEHITITNTDPTYNLIIPNIAMFGGSFVEDFNDGLAQNWVAIPSADWSVLAGEYRAQAGAISVRMQSLYLGQSWQDSSAQVLMRCTGELGDAAVLVLRATDDFIWGSAGSAYLFAISGDGSYYVGKYVNGSFSMIQTWTSSPLLNGGGASNTVLASVQGSNLRIYLNGQLAWSGADSSIASQGRVGLLGYSGSSTEAIHYYDNVLVGDPVTSLAAVDAQQQALNADPLAGGSAEVAPPVGAIERRKSGGSVPNTLLVSGPFRLNNVPILPFILAPRSALTLDLEFVPGAVGTNAGKVAIDSNDADQPHVEVQFSGQGIPDSLQVTPATGFTAYGPIGGPFIPPSTGYVLSNSSAATINWSASNTQSWVNISPSSGTLVPSGTATVVASLTPLANSLPLGVQNDTLVFSNQTTTAVQQRPVALTVQLPVIAITNTGSALLTENCGAGNGVIDPSETVTLNLGLANVGNVEASNVVATLLATGGVASPSGSQNYGTLMPGGTAVSNSFTFTVVGACGGSLVATLQLQSGTTNLGTVAFSFRLGASGTVFSENFDGVTAPSLPAGWTASLTGAGTPWTTTTALRDTTPNAVFAPDPSNTSENWLTSPSFFLPPGGAQLSFRHAYSTESCCDACWLQISIAGGTFTDILTAGGSFGTNGYTAGSGWRGLSTGYPSFITTVANLPTAAANQNIQLRWRFTSDSSVSAVGWYVDTVSVGGGYTCCGPPIIVTEPASQTVRPGTNVTLCVTATGVLSYQWRKDGTNLVNGGRIGGATSACLTLASVVEADSGQYSVALTNNDGWTISSNATLLVSALDHFAWSVITSPQTLNVPFAATITAQDYLNSPVTNFIGTVGLSGLAGGGLVTNTILNSPAYTYSGSGTWTLGYAFTPNTNLTVTHVRHYFGTKVSIWTDAGTLVAAQNVASTPGTWVETALTAPVQLTAGTTYRVAAYTAGGSYYWRSDMSASFPYGTILQGYDGSGDLFPTTTDTGARWWLVDLRYTVGSSLAVPVIPSVSGPFVNGAWSGSITVQQPATNLYLLADDGLGHAGKSTNFTVLTPNDLILSMTAAPGSVAVEQTWTNTITVANTGPAAATGVFVTNVFPGSAAFVSAAASRGSFTVAGNVVTFNAGAIAGGTGANFSVVASPSLGGTITNFAIVTRAEADGDPSNNSAMTTTLVQPPVISITNAGTALLAEGCVPGNGAIDPGEAVTLNLGLANVGNVAATNLVATLLATGGVTSPSGPQNYGRLQPGGPAVSNAFTFTATGTCGGTLVATLQVQSGTNNLGTVVFSFLLGVSGAVFTENFDGVTAPNLPSGWTASLTGAGTPWTTTTALSDTAPNSVFAPDPSSTSENWLTSPAFFLPAGGAQLSFRHTYYTESCCDACWLQISIAGSTFTDILTAGGSFVTNGYTAGTGWRGVSTGYPSFITTVANLPTAAANQNIQLRWRFTSDSSVSGIGWYMDTVSVGGGYTCCVDPNNPTHFTWDTIPSPECVNVPFRVTIRGRNDSEGVATNFNGVMALAGTIGGSLLTNTMLGSVTSASSGSGSYTLGIGFTPNTNLTVTHVRSYSGTKVSVWTAAGDLLASQNVSGPAGVWTETPLATPLTLNAGTTYVVSFYTGSGSYYYITSGPTNFPNGTIQAGYYVVSGDAFPLSFYSDIYRYLCDLRYTVGSSVPVTIIPAVSGTFTQGVWTGSITVPQLASNLVLRADGAGFPRALANPINVVSLPRLGMEDYGNIMLMVWPLWPAGSPNFVMETCTNLTSGAWSAVPYPPLQIEDVWVVPVEMSQANRFYRLRLLVP